MLTHVFSSESPWLMSPSQAVNEVLSITAHATQALSKHRLMAQGRVRLKTIQSVLTVSAEKLPSQWLQIRH